MKDERPLTREEAKAVLAKVKLAALAAADDGSAKLRDSREAKAQRDRERRELLRRQSEELRKESE